LTDIESDSVLKQTYPNISLSSFVGQLNWRISWDLEICS